MFITLLLTIAAPIPKTEPADWKPVVKDRAFKFDPELSVGASAVEAAKKEGVTAEFTPDQGGFGGDFTFVRKGGPKLTVGGHSSSAFVIRGDALYFADFSTISTGCKLSAYDLTTGKKVWDTPLEGLGPIAHTKYRNRVMIAVEKHPTAKDAFGVVITGWESAGGYIEVRDLGTGKLLANKTFATTELPKP